ncbi:hypothetical protein ACFQY7_14040 [Actinomadura luteofluorescens]|uniref:hypothetical protein n=1 Tax=Actinomadura luteofluorescens TaxID=46163 RepID=UPI00363501E5
MSAAAGWVRAAAASADATAVLVAYPLGFDWMFLYWYWTRFTETGSPFGHSRHLDLKSMYATKAGTPISRSTKRQMPSELLSDRPHTHNALDDAVEQAELFHNLVRWAGPPRCQARASGSDGRPGSGYAPGIGGHGQDRDRLTAAADSPADIQMRAV